MLRFFRLNTPDRWFLILLGALALRLPFLWTGTPALTHTELVLGLLADRLADGELLYRDLWSHMPPLPALFYTLCRLLFGETFYSTRILAAVLMGLHVWQFRQYLSQDDVVSERNFVPIVVYLLLLNLFPDFLILSPESLALFFLLAAAHKTWQQVRVGLPDQQVLSLGFYLGMATLCYLPTASFLLMPIIVLLLYSGTTLRQYFLIVFGYVLPVLVVFFAYFWKEAGSDFYFNFLGSLFSMEVFQAITPLEFFYMSLPMLVLLLVGLFKVAGSGRFINYQVVVHVSLVLWLVCALLAFFLARETTPSLLLLFIPPVAVFGGQLFLLIKKAWVAELSFSLTLGLLLLFLYLEGKGGGVVSVNRQRWQGAQVSATALGPTLLVLGPDKWYYYGSRLATPYLEPQLARRHFRKLDDYGVILNIYKDFKSDMPRWIINQDGTLDSLFQRMPILKRQYREVKPQIYQYQKP